MEVIDEIFARSERILYGRPLQEGREGRGENIEQMHECRASVSRARSEEDTVTRLFGCFFGENHFVDEFTKLIAVSSKKCKKIIK